MDVIVNKNVTEDLPVINLINLEDVFEMDMPSIDSFRDSRGFSYLMIAAERNNLPVVDYILSYGIDPDFEVDGETAASLAMSHRHFGVLLTLLKSNALFPPNFNDDEISEDLKAFVDLNLSLHDKIRKNCNENLKEIFTQNPTLRNFYDLNNNSALRIAIEHKNFKIVEVLLENSIYLGPYEDIDEIREILTEDERRELREIHTKFSSSVLYEPMTTLMSNCKLGPDNDKHPHFLEFIHAAFFFLLEIPSIAVLLNVVAASKHFKIVFDFKRDSVTYLDPFAEPYTDGIFYLSRRIYIGAKDILDPDRRFEVISTMAHELCHYAMFLVYGNAAKPYVENSRSAERFEKIAAECRKFRTAEKLVNLVYQHYPVESQHAELIVRAPQLLALYNYAPEVLAEKRKKFPSLFDFFEKNVVDDMKKALPKIQAEYRWKKDRKISKLKLIILMLVVCLGVTALGSILIGFWLYEPNFSWETMDQNKKLTFMNAPVNYHGVDVKFLDLFNETSLIYDNLSSETIRYGLRRKKSKLSSIVEEFYESNVYLVWNNLTDGLKEKLLKAEINFQGQPVSLCVILSLNCLKLEQITKMRVDTLGAISLTNVTQNQTFPLKNLNTFEIKNLLHGKSMNISYVIDPGTKFFVERYFYPRGTEPHKNNSKNVGYNDVIKTVEKENVFFLFDYAGEGKSTTYRNYWFKLKKNYPWKWVEFVDLKKHLEAYKHFDPSNVTFDDLADFLTTKLFNYTNFEREIFTELLKSNNAIFLWDGVDEISPLYKKFMIQLVSAVRSLTSNWQFISTRPEHNREFRESLKVTPFRLVPLEREDQIKFFEKYFACEKYNDCEHDENVKFALSPEILTKVGEIEKIVESLSNSGSQEYRLTNPLLFKIIATIVDRGDLKVNLKSNLYQIYDIFVEEKLKIAEEKGDIVGTDRRLINKEEILMKVHMAYAIKTIFGASIDGFLKAHGYSLSDFKILKNLGNREISRFGIITVITDGNFDFIHQTFAEFFCAQYFIENMDEFDIKERDSQLRLYLFGIILYTIDKNQLVKSFIQSYTQDPRDKFSPIFQLLHEQQNYNFPYNETTDEIKNFLNFMELSQLFLDKHNIKYENYLIFNAYTLGPNDFDELINKWSEFDKFYRERFRFVFNVKNKENQSILHEVIIRNHPKFESFLKKLSDKFSNKEIESILELKSENYMKNLLIFAARFGKVGHFNALWKFVTDVASENDLKKILKLEDDKFYTILHHAAINKDVETFLSVKEIYYENFSEEEIQNLILNVNDEFLPFIYDVITSSDIKSSRVIAVFLDSLFKLQRSSLEGFLTFRNRDGRTLFQASDEHSNKIKIFEELLAKTIDSKKFQKLVKALKIKNKIARIFNFNRKISNDSLREIRDEPWRGSDFEYFVDNFDEIESNLKENLKFLLLYVKKENSTLLHELVTFQDDRNYTKEFLNKVAAVLNPTQIENLLFYENDKTTSLDLAVKFLELENLRDFWNFIERFMVKDAPKKLLRVKDKKLWTPLQHSAIRSESDIFDFISNIYENSFEPNEIREIILESKPPSFPFIFDVIGNGNNETSRKVSNYLEHIFENSTEKRKLREFLSYRNGDGDTLFSHYTESGQYWENMEIFLVMLSHTFNNDEVVLVDDFLKLVKTPTRVKTFFESEKKIDIKKLRENEWNSNDFEFFTKNWKKISEKYGVEFNSILTSRDNKSRTLLYEISSHEDRKFMLPFLDILKSSLAKNNRDSIKNMILEQENFYKRNILMEAVAKRNYDDVKYFWSFVREFLSKSEMEKLLTMEDIYYKTVFHFCVRNKDEKTFRYVIEQYEMAIGRSRVRDMMFKVHENWYPFTYEAFTEGSVGTCREMLNYFLDLWKSKPSALRVLFGFLKDKDKIFKGLNVINLKEKIKVISGFSSEIFGS